jgi:hypothetical protein
MTPADLKVRTTTGKKKASSDDLKRLWISRVVNVQAKAIASSVERQYHRQADDEALARRLVNATVLNASLNRFTRLPTRPRTIAEARAGVKYRAHFSLTSKHFSSITE